MDFAELFFLGQKRLDHVGIELAGHLLEDNLLGLFVAKGRFIDPFGGQRVVDVGKAGDSAGQRNRLADQAVGIAAAVVAFVVGPGDVAGHAEELGLRVGEDRRIERHAAGGRVLLHHLELFLGQRAGFQEDPVGDAHLADVVQRSGQVDQVDEIGVDLIPELFLVRKVFGDNPAVFPHPLDVRAGTGELDNSAYLANYGNITNHGIFSNHNTIQNYGTINLYYDGTHSGMENVAPIPVNIIADPKQEIPEFPSVAIPIAAIVGLAFIFQRRKN